MIFEKKYKTTYKMTFTLSKKASSIKEIKVFATGHYYTAKGKKTNYRLYTYSASDSVGGAYSSWTKLKTYTVK